MTASTVAKRCTKCGETKPLDDFYPMARGGRRAECKKCTIKAATRRNAQLIAEAKQRREIPPPCVDCGAVDNESYCVQRPDTTWFRLCHRCWDKMVGAAALAAFR